jgi:hypothetical protein
VGEQTNEEKMKADEQYRIVFGPNGQVAGDGTTVI